MIRKQCAECGEWFEATNGRQKYCTKMHYRPCPGCGKMIEVKWPSYPTPFCSRQCSSNFRKGNRPASVVTNDAEEPSATMPTITMAKESERLNVEDMLENKTVILAEYTGPKTCGWIPGHNYLVTLTRNTEHTYMMRSEKDCTENADINIGIALSSTISINQSFKRV